MTLKFSATDVNDCDTDTGAVSGTVTGIDGRGLEGVHVDLYKAIRAPGSGWHGWIADSYLASGVVNLPDGSVTLRLSSALACLHLPAIARPQTQAFMVEADPAGYESNDYRWTPTVVTRRLLPPLPEADWASPYPAVPGTRVVISGRNLFGMTYLKFGDAPVTDFTVASDSEIDATVPPVAVAAGTKVPIFVYGPGGKSKLVFDPCPSDPNTTCEGWTTMDTPAYITGDGLLDVPAAVVDTSYSLDLAHQVSTPDGGRGEWTVPAGSAFFVDPAGEFHWTPSNADLGAISPTVTYRDQWGLTSTFTFTVPVLPRGPATAV